MNADSYSEKSAYVIVFEGIHFRDSGGMRTVVGTGKNVIEMDFVTIASFVLFRRWG